jgi:tetratricopeptide (TPR) repeat protein
VQEGVAYHQEDRLQEAMEAYEKALSVRPHDANCLCNIGSIYDELDEIDKALPLYEKAHKLHPDHVSALHNMAANFEKQKKFAEGITALEKVLKVQPENEGAQQFLQDLQQRVADASGEGGGAAPVAEPEEPAGESVNGHD